MTACRQSAIAAICTGLLASGTLLPTLSSGQSALEKVERRVRREVEQKQPAEPAAAADAKHGYLGILADDHDVSGLGVRITEVMVDGPADKAGIKPGDLVTKIGDRLVRDIHDFSEALADQPPGKKLRFVVEREWEPRRIGVTLGHRPPQAQRRFGAFGHQPADEDAIADGEVTDGPTADDAATDNLAEDRAAAGSPPPPAKASLLGVRVEEVDAATQKKLSLPDTRGALVASVTEGSPAQVAGVPVGAVIIAFDGQRIAAPSDLKRALDAAGPGKEIRLDYYFRGRLIERTVRLAELVPPLEAPAQNPAGELPEMAEEAADADRIERLERRIRELEARLAELERRLADSPE
jgi:serine protease Do